MLHIVMCQIMQSTTNELSLSSSKLLIAMSIECLRILLFCSFTTQMTSISGQIIFSTSRITGIGKGRLGTLDSFSCVLYSMESGIWVEPMKCSRAYHMNYL